MEYHYNTSGVCSRAIDFTVEDGKILITDTTSINDVKYTGGCNGNLKGISELVKGMEVDEVIRRLENIKCGFKGTSCPAQLAVALKEIKEKED